MSLCGRTLCVECRKMQHDCSQRGGRWLCPGCYYGLAFKEAAMTQPSAEAVKKAEETFETWQRVRAKQLGLPEYKQPELTRAFALALDAFARERERAVWEEAAKFVDTNRCRDSFRMDIGCGHVTCEYSKAVADAFRASLSAEPEPRG